MDIERIHPAAMPLLPFAVLFVVDVSASELHSVVETVANVCSNLLDLVCPAEANIVHNSRPTNKLICMFAAEQLATSGNLL